MVIYYEVAVLLITKQMLHVNNRDISFALWIDVIKITAIISPSEDLNPQVSAGGLQ